MALLEAIGLRLREHATSHVEQFDTIWQQITGIAARADLPVASESWLLPYDLEFMPLVVEALSWRRTRSERGITGGSDTVEILTFSILGGTTSLQLLHPGFVHLGDCLLGRFVVLQGSPAEAESEELIEVLLAPLFEHFVASFRDLIAEPFLIKMLQSLVVIILQSLSYCLAGKEEKTDQLIKVLDIWRRGWILLGTHYGTWYLLTAGEGGKQEINLPDS
jgi:hypothetical protein